MRSFHLFAGAGGPSWTDKLIGWRCVAAVEINTYCRRVLQARQDDGSFEPFPIFGDIRQFDGAAWRGRVDVVTAGFPCQPFSKAGAQRGADDPKNMWPDTASCIRQIQPEWIFLENVPALLVSGYYTTVLSDLASLGFDVVWGVLGAGQVGAPHKRGRLWIVGRCLANVDSGREPQPSPRWRDKRDRLELRREAAPIPNADGQRWIQRRKEEEQPQRQRHAARRRQGSSWWSKDPADATATTQPNMARLVHGVAHRRQRTRALGNGWVPEVAFQAWHQLSRRIIKIQGEHV